MMCKFYFEKIKIAKVKIKLNEYNKCKETVMKFINTPD